MRLTLRTLLAYRDGVLSAAVHDDFHRRLQQNPHISNLLRHINALVQSTDVLSPKLEASGLSDANIIAEYLDDVLTSSSVSELERLCLENPEHLCELAHCHQLLAESMNTRVVIPESLREKMRSIDNLNSRTIENSIGYDSPVEVNVEAPMAVSGGGTIKEAGLNLEANHMANEVPDYLLTATRRRWQIPVAIAGLTVLLGLLVWQLIGSPDSLRSLWYGNKAPGSVATKANDSKTESATDSDNIFDDVPVNEQAGEPKAGPIDSKPDLEGTTPSESNVKATDQATGERTDVYSSTIPNDPTTTEEHMPATEQPEVESPDTSRPDESTSDAASAPSDASSTPQGLSFVPGTMGQSKAAVLFQAPDSPLQLLSELEAPATSGRVIIAPATRTALRVGGWRWTVGGANVVNFDATSSEVKLSTALFRGIVTAADPQAPLELDTPAGKFAVSVADSSVWLGIEVGHRPVASGSISQAQAYAPALIIVAGSDDAADKESLVRVRSMQSEQEVTIRQAGRGVAIIGSHDMVEFALQNPPSWYRQSSVRLIDQEASGEFFAALTNRESTVEESIDRLTTSDRPELAALAIQSSMLLGKWHPFVDELLNSDRLRSHWTSTIDLARQIALVSPAVLQGIEKQFEEHYASDAQPLVDLFVGLTAESQQADGLLVLIKGLESDRLPTRVLSSYELSQLTGSEHGILPHAPLRPAIQQLKRQAAAGKLSTNPVGDPVWERVAVP